HGASLDAAVGGVADSDQAEAVGAALGDRGIVGVRINKGGCDVAAAEDDGLVAVTRFEEERTCAGAGNRWVAGAVGRKIDGKADKDHGSTTCLNKSWRAG